LQGLLVAVDRLAEKVPELNFAVGNSAQEGAA
jgi:hypothetical protein